jgi:hypothetical protein
MAEAPTLIIGVDDTDSIASELARLETVYVLWETWIGPGQTLIYARRTMTSPPIVVKADNTAQVWEQVREQERRIAARRDGAPPAGGAPGSELKGTTQ